MNFSVRNQLVNFHLLFQIAVFVGELSCCSSVTYHPSADTCKGSDLEDKCKGSGEKLARIKDSASLTKVKAAIGDGQEYWTALRYHKNHGYCWDRGDDDDDDCEESASKSSISSILDNAGEASWTKGWYCFWVSTAQQKLQVQRCSDNSKHPYICEKDDPSSELLSMQASSASVQPVTIVTKTMTEPMSTAMSTVTTSRRIIINELSSVQASSTSVQPVTIVPKNTTEPMSTVTTSRSLPKLTTLMITTEKLLTPSITLLTTAVATAPILTNSLTSSLLTTEEFIVKETLTMAGTASSLTVASTKKTTTQEKLSAKEQLRQYVSAINALNASEETSLQNAVNTTSNLFRSLKEDKIESKDINVLLATQELEKFAISYGKIHYKRNESNVVSKEHFALKIQKVPEDNQKDIIFSVNETGYSTKDGSAIISLPSEIFIGQEAIVVSILYNGIKKWIPDAKDVELDGMKFKKLEMGSRIIATTVDPKPTDTLEENVTITSSHDKDIKKGDKPHCVFWDFTAESELNGSWASTGCTMIQTVDREITCSCNHLTNFAVLMQVGDNKVSSDHRVALKVITYIGCGFSLTGELLTIIAYCALMNLKQEQVQIRLNLVVAIAIAQIVFLSGIDASEIRGVCVFVAALIHYFYLAGFAWMLFEGVYLYLMVVKVFNTVVRMRLFYAFAWGFPLVMVVLSLVIASSQDGGVDTYVHGDFCWVSFTNNLIWTFAAPVLAVCLINSIILARVLYEIIRMQSDKTSEMEKIRQGLKALAVLFPLLGLTWLFGILIVTDAGLVFQYIFTILNSLQGFFIFVIHVLRNSDVRGAFFRKKQKWKESRNFSTSRVSSQGADAWSNKMASQESQELRPRRNERTRSSTAGHSNMSIVEPERTLTPVQM